VISRTTKKQKAGLEARPGWLKRRERREQLFGDLHLAAEDRVGAEFFLDAEELVVLGHAVGAAERTGFDLAGIRGHAARS
jgi:hypothetical protein